jgi:hypothetical protein
LKISWHRELCLKLDKPLCIVVTKLDLASKSSLRQTLSKILSAVKATGRTPSIIPPDQGKTMDSNLTTVAGEEDVVRGVIEKMDSFDGLTSIVPIGMSVSNTLFFWGCFAHRDFSLRTSLEFVFDDFSSLSIYTDLGLSSHDQCCKRDWNSFSPRSAETTSYPASANFPRFRRPRVESRTTRLPLPYRRRLWPSSVIGTVSIKQW